MSIARSSIKMGPAAVKIGSTYIYFKDGLKLSTEVKTFNVEADGFGSDPRYDDIMLMLSGTPSGMWTTGLLSILYPWLNPTSGTSIFGASDTALVILPLNGTDDKITFPSYGVSKMPSLTLSAGRTAFGEIEFSLPVKNNTAWSDSAARFAIASQVSFPDSSFAFASIPTVPYSVSLSGASSPWDAIVTKAGVQVDFGLKLSDIKLDSDGTVDRRISDLEVSVKLAAANPTMSEILAKLALQGSGVARGVSFAAGGADMTITGGVGNPIVVVKGARLKSAPLNFNSKDLLSGDLTFAATRSSGTGAWATVGVAA